MPCCLIIQFWIQLFVFIYSCYRSIYFKAYLVPYNGSISWLWFFLGFSILILLSLDRLCKLGFAVFNSLYSLLSPIFPSFRPMGMVGEACLPSNAYYPRTPDYTLCSGVHVCWSEHSDSSFVYGFMILNYGFGTMIATTFNNSPFTRHFVFDPITIHAHICAQSTFFHFFI